jgi:hypothetical protein
MIKTIVEMQPMGKPPAEPKDFRHAADTQASALPREGWESSEWSGPVYSLT